MPRRLRLYVSWLTAGQADAGLASLASFAVGVYAVRVLPPSGVGAYALMFSAFSVVSQFPAQLIFVPSEVHAVGLEAGHRMGVIRVSLRRGVPVALGSSLGMLVAGLPVGGNVDPGTIAALSVSGLALSVVSPVQDHFRRLLHLDGQSWKAAALSGVYLIATLTSLGLVGLVSPPWAPLGAPAIGNVISIGFAVVLLRGMNESAGVPTTRELLTGGKWLLAAGLASTGFAYASAALLGHLSGIDALGFAEGARVVAQPINIVGLGLVAFFAPRAMEAAHDVAIGRARRLRAWFVALLAIAAACYVGVVGFDSGLNPLVDVIPNGYAVAGLAAVSVGAAFLNSASSPWRAEIMAIRSERALGQAAVSSGLLELGVVFALAPQVGSFALPLAVAAGAGARWALYSRRLAPWYREGQGMTA